MTAPSVGRRRVWPEYATLIAGAVLFSSLAAFGFDAPALHYLLGFGVCCVADIVKQANNP